MPVVDLNEARDVDNAIERVLAAANLGEALQRLRSLFVELLDFGSASGTVALHDSKLPSHATRIAEREGVQVVAIELQEKGRVRAADLRAALGDIGSELGGDLLLIATESTHAEWHFVYPTVQAGRHVLRRAVVYQGQPCRTVAEQLAGIYRDVAAGRDLRAALERAYDVEAVTKRFFQKHREIFERVMTLVTGLPDDEERKLFCQALFNRLMFLYFLQRKGWLTFDGDPDYLEALWTDVPQCPDENFYESRLIPLFFTALNNPRTANWDTARYAAEPLVGKVPFLNGGLFATGDLNERTGVIVPNEAIRLILRELFARFNFTIAESTPYDVHVAVDPEMLGKVFEELVTGRHETGSYYTPRPIVTFMCREALKGYLTTHVMGLSQDVTSAFVDDHDVSGLNVEQARQVFDALETITVLDPACGSGAYLLGMLHELVELQLLLYSSNLVRDAKSLYELKLRVIQRNVYGADIDPFAVNIAMLRLWLSLVIDYEGTGDPPALPNLDFKIVRGDSLSAPDPTPSLQPDMFRAQVHVDAIELARLKAEYMRTQGDEKRFLADQIAEKQAQLVNMLAGAPAPTGSVDWRVEFAEVFDARGGFDVVLANPPYVRMELFKDQKPILRRNFPLVHSDRADLYVYFYGRALELLRNGGMLTFISSNKWLRAGYGANLRKHIAETTAVWSIIDFGDLPVFEVATSYPVIFIAQRGRADRQPHLTVVRSLVPPYPDVRHLVEQSGGQLPREALNGADWTLVAGTSASRLRTMVAAGITLEQYVDGQIYYGIKTGLNDAFIVDDHKRSEILKVNPESNEIIKPFIMGEHVRKWYIKPRGLWILYMYRGVECERYYAVIDHLRQYKDRLEKRATKQRWYELQQPQMRYSQKFDQAKIVYPIISKDARFSLDQKGAFINDKAYTIPLEDMYLLGVLNSTAAWDLLRDVCSVLRGGFFELRHLYLSKLPIPDATPTERSAIASLVRQCLDAKGQGPMVGQWEAEINERVTLLYGLGGVDLPRLDQDITDDEGDFTEVQPGEAGRTLLGR